MPLEPKSRKTKSATSRAKAAKLPATQTRKNPREFDNLVAEFCESRFLAGRGFLERFAPEVVLIARMTRSSRRTAEFLSERFGRKFSRRPVESLLAKVQAGTVVVTHAQLFEVAKQHPVATQFAETLLSNTESTPTKTAPPKPTRETISPKRPKSPKPPKRQKTRIKLRANGEVLIATTR